MKFGVLLGEGREHGVGGVDQLRELRVLFPEGFDHEAEVVDRAGDVRVADFELLGDLFGVVGGRVEALERGRQGLAVVVQPFAEAGEQLLQVDARFRVEPGEEFVEVDVRGRLRDRHHLAALELAGRRVAGVDLDRDVLELGLRPKQEGGVAVDVAAVLRLDLHRHERHAPLEVDGRDFADLGPRDRDRLALARGDRLGGLEFGAQHVVGVPEHGNPPRQLEVLVGEDVAADEGRDQDHRDHRDEGRAVALDLIADAEPALSGFAGLILRSRRRGPGTAGR